MPYATQVRSLFATDKYVYMGDDYNIHLSADSGKSWTASDIDRRGSFGNILGEGQNLFVIQGDGQIRKSTSNGYSFENTGRVFGGARSLVFLTGATNYLFVNSDYGVHRSKDHGVNWESALAAE
jgi:hypothetical protein